MLDHLTPERSPGSSAQSRLRVYMAALLVLGAIVLGIANWPSEPGAETLARAPEDPTEAKAQVPRIDRDQIPAADDEAAHSRWQLQALLDLLPVAEKDFTQEAERISAADLVGLDFAAARGRVYESEGTVEEVISEDLGRSGLLWTVVIGSEDGGRFLVLKHGLASDAGEGRPEEALRSSTEYVQAGNRVLVRGIYLQRRTGTFGGAIFRQPAPVLVATPPSTAFRILPPAAVAIEDVGEADWDEIEDRFLRETKKWEEPALFQVLAWAARRGHDEIAREIAAGELVAQHWDQEMFVRWSDEIESETATSARPVTREARGKLWKTSGLIGNFVYQGWDAIPREASAWGVDHLYVLDLQSDHYGNAVIRTVTPFPLDAFEGVTGEVGQHVRVYGYFLKNYTYDTRKPREEGGRAIVTLPFFVVVHMEPIVPTPSPYRMLMWFISGGIVLLALLFYFVLIRGENKEAARMQAYRTGLKRRIREHEAKRREGRGSQAPPPQTADEDEAGS